MRRAVIGLAASVALSILSWPVISTAATDDGRPAALVESIKSAPAAGVQFLDYVTTGQTVDLGSDGEITLYYFESCSVETVRGGRLTVDQGASKVEDGRVETKKVPCQGSKIVVQKETGEAGGSVTRVTPFQGQDWSEWTTKSSTPIFKWNRAGNATVKVVDLDADPRAVVWTGSVNGNHLAYPPDAPTLQIGVPYQVQVSLPDSEPLTAAFSIDPDLELPDTVLSRIIPVGR